MTTASPESNAWPKLIESLAGICKQHPIDRKVLLVQNHHSGQLILRAVAKCSGGWLNLYALTPAQLAWESIASEASARGLAPADDVAVEGLILEAYQSTRRSFFPENPPLGLLAAIGHAISELRIAGVQPADLRSPKAIHRPKAIDLAGIMDKYVAMLDRESLLDEAGDPTIS